VPDRGCPRLVNGFLVVRGVFDFLARLKSSVDSIMEEWELGERRLSLASVSALFENWWSRVFRAASITRYK